jgi:hypothetical protein
MARLPDAGEGHQRQQERQQGDAIGGDDGREAFQRRLAAAEDEQREHQHRQREPGQAPAPERGTRDRLLEDETAMHGPVVQSPAREGKPPRAIRR